LFRPAFRAKAATLLTEQCGNNLPFLEEADKHALERVRFAALKLSGGKLSELRKAIRLAKEDWRDLLVAAGFADDTRAYQRWLTLSSETPYSTPREGSPGEDAGFIRAILAAPEDVSLKLIYADWLDERDDPRGEYLRHFATLNEPPAAARRNRKLRRRLQELEGRIDPLWKSQMRMDFVWSDAWVFLSLDYARRPADRARIVAAGDTMNHAILMEEELEGGLRRLRAWGYAVERESGFNLGPKGYPISEEVSRVGFTRAFRIAEKALGVQSPYSG
jgi:uncharacterized protein (TIGR02996 family)